MSSARHLALCGGVGGAKLAHGLSRVLPAGALTVAVNTGDDFEHLGLSIWPDVDTVTYTLAGVADPGQGWGRAGEIWNVFAELERLGGPTWFRLGDRDLALHLLRRALLDEGLTPGEVTARIAHRFGIHHEIVPMTDGRVRTMIDTAAGPLPFQHYFVRERCAPAVRGIRYVGAAESAPSPALLRALEDPALAGVILCPSNPYLSIDPILALPGVRERLRRLSAPVIAVSPIIGGTAVKGPTAKIMADLGTAPSAAAVAGHYKDFLRGYLLDPCDAAAVETAATGESAELSWRACDVLMKSEDDRVALARRCLDFIAELAVRT